MYYIRYTKFYNHYFSTILIFLYMTFKDFYQEAKNQPSAAKAFIKEIALLTHRTEIAVRKWLAGECVPDMNVVEKLSSHFNVPAEELFPSLTHNKVLEGGDL